MRSTPLLRAGFDYVRRNPLSLVTFARQAARLRAVVPLDVVRWGLGKVSLDRVSDFSVSSRDGGLGIALTVNVMGARLRVSGVVHVSEIVAGHGLLRLDLRLADLKVDPVDGPAGPIQALLASGAIDLKKPGNLVGMLPMKPAILVEAEGDRIVLDLMRLRKLARNAGLQRALGAISPVLSIRDVETKGDDLLIGLRVRPTGLPLSIAALRV